MAVVHFNSASYNEFSEFQIHKGKTMLLYLICSILKHLNHKTTLQQSKGKDLERLRNMILTKMLYFTFNIPSDILCYATTHLRDPLC